MEKSLGEPLPVKLIRSYMAHRLFWVEIHREARRIVFRKRRVQKYVPQVLIKYDPYNPGMVDSWTWLR